MEKQNFAELRCLNVLGYNFVEQIKRFKSTFTTVPVKVNNSIY